MPNALAGYQIENRYLNLSYPPHEPSVVEDKYWFGWFWERKILIMMGIWIIYIQAQ